MITLEQAVIRATGQLSAHPDLRPTALPDAALLLMNMLGISRATLIAHPEYTLTLEQQASYQRLLERRLTFEPIQYILGVQEFFGLTLRVTPAVLIPRPETEILVEAVLDRVSPGTSLRIADVGTGSGAIAIALAAALPQASVTAVDLSKDALAIARQNVEAHLLADRIRLLSSDLLTALLGEAPFDIIVSNPPYVSEADRPTLHPQVRDYEPSQALFAGPLGVEIYRRLIPQARTLLQPGGLLALEIGYSQRDSLAALLVDWDGVAFIPDLQHVHRVVIAYNPG